MDLNTFLFYFLATLTGACAIGVVLTQNIVRAATWLLFALGGAAGIFFLLGADFVGATQLLVYVGGTLVLVVFGVMLTAQGPFIQMRVGAAEWGIALGVGLLLYGALAVALLQSGGPRSEGLKPQKEAELAAAARQPPSTTVLGEVLLGARAHGKDAGPTPIISGYRLTASGGDEGISQAPVTYLLPFEIVSVHLLVVLIAAAYLARSKRRRSASGAAAGSLHA